MSKRNYKHRSAHTRKSARNAPQIDANLSDSSLNLPSSLFSFSPTFPSLPFKSPRSLSISHFRPERQHPMRLLPLHPHSPSSWDPVFSTSEALECALVSLPACCSTSHSHHPPPFRLWNLLLQWLPGLLPLDYLPFRSALRDPHCSPTQ